MARKKICVALQGGGAHGAYTWGVLDRLLEDGTVEFEAVSGTSAGAMNGAVMVDALKRGGPQHARERLERFWRSISEAGDGVFKPGRMLPPAFGPNADWSPMALWSDMLSLVWSPYNNLFYRNVLADVISSELPDFAALNDHRTPHLFVCATNVKTNQRKVFGAGKLGIGALTASACLPTVFQSIEVDGEFYWDGGYMGNPALSPLRSPSLVPDLLIVWVNPMHRVAVPTDARDILDRQNEITFNAALVQEIETIDAVNELKGTRDSPRSAYKRIRLHEIKDDPALAQFGHASKSNTDWDFLLELREFGRQAAQEWIETKLKCVGVEKSADMRRLLSRLESH
jgi:NTE family protein